MKNLILIISLISLFLASCAPQMTREQVAASFTETKDPYTGYSSFSGTFFSIGNSNLISTRSDVSLVRGFINGKGSLTGMGFVIWARDWYFLNSCYVMNYGEIEVLRNNRQVDVTGSSVGVKESISIFIPQSLLMSRKDSGIQMKFVGDRGDVELVIPSYYIQGYLDALER